MTKRDILETTQPSVSLSPLTQNSYTGINPHFPLLLHPQHFMVPLSHVLHPLCSLQILVFRIWSSPQQVSFAHTPPHTLQSNSSSALLAPFWASRVRFVQGHDVLSLLGSLSSIYLTTYSFYSCYRLSEM